MTFLKAVLFGSLMLAGSQVFAQGAVRYQTLSEAFKSGFYRVTCSSFDDIQVHIYAVAKKKAGRGPNNEVKIDDLKVVSLAPAHSLNVMQFSRQQFQKLSVSETSDLKISGSFPVSLFDTEFELKIQESIKNDGAFSGQFYYTDNDGLTIDRPVQCGLVNYLLNP